MKSTRFLAAFLALVMVLSALPVTVGAREQEPTENRNIVIMTDSGGSMINGLTSDPHGYRISAISMFFDLLCNIGDHICVIDFKGNNRENDSSDEAMRELIRCYPEGGLTEITSLDQTEGMKNFIKRDAGGYTDIGTALLMAAEQLDGKTKENGLDSYIFLFTDGKTEFKESAPKTYLEQSRENQNKALEIIRENGITLCAIYLDNKNLNHQEVPNILRASITADANEQLGLSDDDLKNMGRYERVTNAASLSDVFQNVFTRLSSASMRELAPTDTFVIPGSTPGSIVREVNLCITTKSSNENDTDIVPHTKISSLTNSRTGPVSGEYLFDCRSIGKAYVVYKLVAPEPGEYQIQWTSPDPNATCRIIMDADLSADLSSDPVPGEFRYNNYINFEGWLCGPNGKLTDAAAYSGFTCELVIIDQSTDQPVHNQQVFQNEDGVFSAYYLPLSFGKYYAQMSFTCGDLKITSGQIPFQIDNYPPVVKDDSVRISLSFGSDGVRELPLSDYISDAENTVLSTLVIVPHETNTYPETAFAIADDNSTLTIRGREGGNGTLTLSVSDTQGKNSVLTLQISARNNTVLILLLILLIAAALAFLCLLLRKQVRSGLHVRGKIFFELKIKGSKVRTRHLDVMECLHKDLYTALSCRKNMLICELAEYVGFRQNAEKIIHEFLHDNRRILESHRLIAVPRPGGHCSLQIVSRKAASDPVSELLAKLPTPGTPIVSDEPHEISLPNGESCTITYQDR